MLEQIGNAFVSIADWFAIQHVKATIRRPPYWTSLRSLSNTSVVRAFILIPLIGYWIILNDNIVSSIADLSCFLDPGSCQADSDPGSTGRRLRPKHKTEAPWRLFATYFGLCLVAVGSAIYQLLCPPEIKQYSSSSLYSATADRGVSESEMARVMEALESGDAQSKTAREELKQVFQRRWTGTQQQGFSEEDRRKEVDDYWRNILHAHFDLCNSRCYPGRLAATTFYVSGFGVLLVPSLDVFGRVTRVVWRSLW